MTPRIRGAFLFYLMGGVMDWNTEQVLNLAPDASSAKAGRGLAKTSKWLSLNQQEQAIWGECQGSGSKPYHTQVDLSEPAFKCTCPSRKFPCKHSIGLMLLFAEQREQFQTASEQPEWVSDWLAKRQQREAKQAAKASATEVVDTEAQAKRQAQRSNRVDEGIAELAAWMQDIMRQGLAELPQRSYGFFDDMAARLVDAQAPGLAAQVRSLNTLVSSQQAGWDSATLAALGRLHLLLEAYQRRDNLPAEQAQEIASLIGWTQNKEALLEQQGIRDQWFVLGQYQEQEERMLTQRTWLQGQSSGRKALLLDFSFNGNFTDSPQTRLVIGSQIDAELVFYPSLHPQRALLKNTYQCTVAELPAGYPDITSAHRAWRESRLQNPWLTRFPLLLQAVIPQFDAEQQRFSLHDQQGQTLACRPPEQPWQLLACSGGAPLSVFGEWRDSQLHILGVQGEMSYLKSA